LSQNLADERAEAPDPGCILGGLALIEKRDQIHRRQGGKREAGGSGLIAAIGLELEEFERTIGESPVVSQDC
jgi:hypothetical protein